MSRAAVPETRPRARPVYSYATKYFRCAPPSAVKSRFGKHAVSRVYFSDGIVKFSRTYACFMSVFVTKQTFFICLPTAAPTRRVERFNEIANI